jgi:hypothetical protein
VGGSVIRAVAVIAALALSRPAAAAEILAVVIGWNGGSARLAPLSFADDDAVRFALFFSALRSREAPGRVWLLTETDAATDRTLAAAHLSIVPDAPPTRAAVLGALAELARTLRARPPAGPRVLYVVYAGHGVEGRLLLKPDAGGEAALTGSELRAALAGVREADSSLRMFVFLDACRSESLFSERGDSGADFGSAIAELERKANAVPVGILTAARNGRPAGEVRGLEAGYFSHVLTSGLAGAADADGDDVVSFGELAAFVAFHTRKLTGQMPWFEPPGGDLSASAMDHRGRRARLQLPFDQAGRYLVGAGTGRPVFAEAFKARGHMVRLALPPGHYSVRREENDGRGWDADVDLGADSVDLAAVPWRPRSSARGPDDAPVFSADFSPDVVSTLEAGFHAGRARPSDEGRFRLQLEAGWGTAPLRLGGGEPMVTLRVRRRFGPAHLALIARAATSTHTAGQERFDLRRFALGLEVGRGLRLGGRFSLEAFAAGGWSSVVRTAPSGTSGDLASPWAEAGARAWAWLAGPWWAVLSARLAAAWVNVDGSRPLSAAPAADIGVGVTF